MLKLNINNETSRLRAVVLGIAQSNGPVPKIEECYDPKSIEHVKAGTYPKEADMILEMEAVAIVFEKYGVKTLLIGRFIPFGVRNVLFITSGLIKMRLLKFMVVDLIALSVTSTILFSLGYSFGHNYKVIIPYLDRYKYIIFFLALAIASIISLLFNSKLPTW